MKNIIGVDFGSSACRIAFWNNGIPEVFRVIGTRKSGNSSNDSVSVKRQWLGGSPDAAETAVELLKEICEQNSADKAAFSVPILFDEDRLQEFEETAEEEGFEVAGVVTESAAAGLAYAYPKKKTGLLAVYCFGAGFSECGILRLRDGQAEWLGGEGLALGGEDLDLCLRQNILKQMGPGWSQSQAVLQAVLEESEKARCALSHRGSYDFVIEDLRDKKKFSQALSRFEFAKWLREKVEKSAALCEAALRKANIKKEEVDEVVLAGGVTRAPYVVEAVEKIFGKKLSSDSNPEHAAAVGALIYASAREGALPGGNLKLKNF